MGLWVGLGTWDLGTLVRTGDGGDWSNPCTPTAIPHGVAGKNPPLAIELARPLLTFSFPSVNVSADPARVPGGSV